jgi:hypothetical protein
LSQEEEDESGYYEGMNENENRERERDKPSRDI